MLELVCTFRMHGLQLPLRDGDTVRLRRRGSAEDYGPIPAEIIVTLVAHYFYGLDLQDRLRASLPSRKPLALSRGPVPLDVQEARRARRRRTK